MGDQSADELPIFPLGTVLFPDGVLPLRVFETRYMDMVRDCLKQESDFGVCLITQGNETGIPASHENVGCTARIAKWDMEQLGVLNIRTLGGQRFNVIGSQTQSDGLIVARVEYLDEEPDDQIPAQFTPCVDLLKKVITDLVEKETDSMRQMVETPYQFESASWVSRRLSEFLPIPGPKKQKLMVLNDPVGRLTVLMDFLVKQQVI